MKPIDIPDMDLIPEMPPMPQAKPPEVLPLARVVPEEPPPSVLPIAHATLVEDEEASPPWPEVRPLQTRPIVRRRPADSGWVLWNGLRAVVGWWLRWLIGATLCFSGLFVVSYVTAVVVVGWTYRWMQALVLRHWWRQSPLRQTLTFRAFCDTLGPDGPTPRPRWFLRERIGETLYCPGRGGQPAGPLQLLGRILSIPVHGLWRNFRLGLQALMCDGLLLGWGCLFMLIGWEFGWLNSFNKGYEQSAYGVTSCLFGCVLFIAAMFYVPMAQAHQAATGQARAFFEFRFIWRLVRARLLAYVGLALLIVLASILLMGLRLSVLSDNFPPNQDHLTPQQGLESFRGHLWLTTLFLLFPGMLMLRLVAAWIYSSAVLKVLRRGTVTRQELNPILGKWFEKLQLNIIPTAAPTGLGWWARWTTRWAVHRLLFTVLFFIWVVYCARTFASYFLVADPIVGFLNHPMIELPCFDWIPPHLYQGRNE